MQFERVVSSALMLAVLFLSLAAAGLPRQAFADERPLNVVATTGMIADAARAIGGDGVVVKALMGPGVDPHSYRQTRSDIAAMVKADLVLRHGLYLEAQMEDFFIDLSAKKPVVAVAEVLPADSLLAHTDYKDKFDPHIWMDPELWSAAVIAVRDALIDLRPADRALFEANAESYLAAVSDLEVYADTVTDTVSSDRAVLVTAHDAFNYFGRAFDFDVVGIQGISTESEAGLSRISELVDFLVDRQISAVFVESSVPDRNIRALVEGAAAKGHTVVIGGELFSDAMGVDGSYEGTYVGMIDHNVTTITNALGGAAPERGMQGRLSAGT